jgi:hypothetical protein
MATVEERLAYLEGRVEEHTRGMGEFRDAVLRFDRRMDGLDLKIDRCREELVGRIDAVDLKIDRCREELVGRIDAVDLKVDRCREELTRRVDRLDGRFDGMDQKISRQFLWLIGVQVTLLLAVIGALLR